MYIATLALDYGGPHEPNARNRLMNALDQAGWSYAETSALYIETENLDEIRLGLELLARAAHTPGTLAALNMQVQLVGEDREPPASANHGPALVNVLRYPLPSQQGES